MAPDSLADLSPQALRGLSHAALEDLAAQIRSFLVETLSATGGHLGPNLGVVELTLALHRRFDSPRDVILWDTGHQAYVHKIVTGRAAEFATLRRSHGLSGYPSQAESAHDWIESCHASASLAYAHAFGLRAREAGTRVVVVVGDGALTGGAAYEGLANIGMTDLPVTVVLNDNGVSYSPTRSRLSSSHGAAGRPARQFFEALGYRVIGPVDGHDLPALEAAFHDSDQGPGVVHVRTEKGRGYGPAEREPTKHMHDTGAFLVDTGEAAERPVPLLTDVFGEEMLRLADEHDDVHAVSAAMPGPVGLLPFAARFPERFHDVGIAEQHAVGLGAGLAMAGYRPVVALYAPFVLRSADQILNDVALHRLPVSICLDRSGMNATDGPSYHALYDLGLLGAVPGLRVLCPTSGTELRAMLRYAVLDAGGPVVIRYSKHPAGPESPAPWPPIAARKLISGRDRLSLVGLGRTVPVVIDVARRLEDVGITASVWNATSASPLDPGMLLDLATEADVGVVEDGVRAGGLGASVAQALGHLPDRPRVRCWGAPDRFVRHGPTAELLDEVGLTAARIATDVLEAVSSSRPVGSP